MTRKQKALAVQFLKDHAANLSNRGCNDWEFPADWTESERAEFGGTCPDWEAVLIIAGLLEDEIEEVVR